MAGGCLEAGVAAPAHAAHRAGPAGPSTRMYPSRARLLPPHVHPVRPNLPCMPCGRTCSASSTCTCTPSGPGALPGPAAACLLACSWPTSRARALLAAEAPLKAPQARCSDTMRPSSSCAADSSVQGHRLTQPGPKQWASTGSSHVTHYCNYLLGPTHKHLRMQLAGRL